MIKFNVWLQGQEGAPEPAGTVRNGRYYYHGINGGNITVPCAEADGYATEREAHTGVTRVWLSFGRAMGIDKASIPAAPYAKTSPLKPRPAKRVAA